MVARIGKCFLKVGGPALDPGALGQDAELLLVAPGEDRVDDDDLVGGDLHAPLVPYGANGTDEVLVGAHAPGDPIHDDSEFMLFHK